MHPMSQSVRFLLHFCILGLLAAGLSPGAFALPCASAAAGPWNAPSTWSDCGGGVPGVGDTVTIAHPVEVTDQQTFGTSPADSSTMVLTVNPTGNLRILDGGLLRMRGNGQLNNAPLNIEQGGVFEIDGTVSGVSYVLRVGTASNQPNAKVNLNGTGFGAMPEFRSTEGGPNGRIWRGASTSGTGMVNCEYGRLRRLGSSTQVAIQYNPAGSNFSMMWDYCSLEESSQVRVENTMHAAAIFEISNSRVVDPIEQTSETQRSAFYVSCAASFSTGRCRFFNNYIERGIQCATCNNISTERNILVAVPTSTAGFGAILGAGSGSAHPQTHVDNLLFSRATASGIRGNFGTFRGNYMIQSSANINPHFVSGNAVAPTIREYNILESLRQSTVQGGDGLTVPNQTGTAHVHTIRFNLVVASPQVICGIPGLGGSSSFIIAHNNTLTNHGCPASRMGETYTGHAGMVVTFHSNAIYYPAGMGSPASHKASHITSTDNVFSECNWNGADTFATGSLGNGYSMVRSAGPCGTNDVNESAGFADPTFRNIGKYYAWVTNTPFVAGDGPGSSFAALLAEWRKKNTSDWDERFDHIRARDWVWAGYAPRNLKYATAGKDGGQIGAVKPVLMFGLWQ